MTENEKAATFIGWLPHITAGHREPPCDCTAAPDMSDPRNYMKALIATAKDYYVEIVPNDEVDGRVWVKIYRGGEPKIEGDQPIKALAALYDAEHSEATK